MKQRTFFAPLSAPFFAVALAAAALAAPLPATPAPPGKPPQAMQSAPARPALPDPAKDDPAKVAAAKEFIQLYHPSMNALNVTVQIQRFMPMFVARAKQDNPKLDVKKFTHEKRIELMQKAADNLDRQAHVVSRHFTLAELKGLIGFFRNSLGARLAAETPKIQRELMILNRQARMAAIAARAKATRVQSDEDDDDDDDNPSRPLAKPKPHK